MTAPTHIVFSNIMLFALAQVFNVRVNPVTISACGLGSLLPDLDTPTSALGRTFFPISTWIERRFGHRTIMHSLLGWVIMGIILTPLLSMSKEIYIAIVLAILSHDLIDMLNVTGVGFFYPSEARAVFPFVRKFPKKYRIAVASMGEFMLLSVLIVSSVGFYPIGRYGFRKCLHYLLGDINGAVSDYRDLAGQYNVAAKVKAIDSITSHHFEGEYPVLGVLGTTNLIIRRDGKLHVLGTKDSADYRPLKVKCFPKEKVNIVLQTVTLKTATLEFIRQFLDETKEQYLYGTLLLEKETKVPQEFHVYNPIETKGKYLLFNGAAWKDVEGYKVSDVNILDGEISIKTVLKEGETLKTTTEDLAMINKNLYNTKKIICFNLGPSSELAVEEGDEIKKGWPLAILKGRPFHSPVDGIVLKTETDPALPYCKSIKVAII